MKLVFTKSAWSDYLWFQDNDKKLLARINNLIKEIERSPFTDCIELHKTYSLQ